METYIRVQTAGDVFRNAARIYRRNFRVFFLATIIPLAPLAFILDDSDGSPLKKLAVLCVWMTLSYAMTIPMTALISDICLGNSPSVRRAYRHVLGRTTGHMLLSMLTVGIVTAVGFMLLIAPGLAAMTVLLLVAPAVVLERRTLVPAFRRSIELGRGFYLRNLLIACTALILASLGAYLVTFLVYIILAMTLHVAPAVAGQVARLAGFVFAPFSSTVIVLIYYDMRARKEAYDSAKLAEDLHR